MRRHRGDEDEANVDMTPMLDIVFIMLIFFIVTTSFVKEDTVEVNRPSKSQTQSTEKNAPVAIEINDINEIRMQGRVIDAGAVQANIEKKRAENPKTVVIIQAHELADTATVISVVDGAREAGVRSPILARLPSQ